MYVESFVVLGWLNLFNTELSLKRYWQRTISKEVGEEGDYA